MNEGGGGPDGMANDAGMGSSNPPLTQEQPPEQQYGQQVMHLSHKMVSYIAPNDIN